MSYTPTEWEPTDAVTATRMNALEQAVGEMNMSYTPNTWSDGDILSAEKMNALEQAVASGGGGSSDFSTAQVAVTMNTLGTLVLPIKYDDGSTETIIADVPDNNATVVLYKGLAIGSVLSDELNVSVSGNANYDSLTGRIFITGDCTITIS